MKNNPPRILFVEDNTRYVRLIDFIIAEENSCWEIKHAQTMQQALEYLEQEPFHLIVLDIFLPDSKGLESLAKIQSLQPQVPIIFLTALNDPKMKSLASKAGVQDYVLKDQLVTDFIPILRKYSLPNS